MVFNIEQAKKELAGIQQSINSYQAQVQVEEPEHPTGYLPAPIRPPKMFPSSDMLILHKQLFLLNYQIIGLLETIVNRENPNRINAQTLIIDTAGTPRQLPRVLVPYDMAVVIKALNTNTGIIYVANSSAEAQDTKKSYLLYAGEYVIYKIRDLSRLWIDSSVSAEGATWTVEQR